MTTFIVTYRDGQVAKFTADYIKYDHGILVFRNTAKPNAYPELVAMVAADIWTSVITDQHQFKQLPLAQQGESTDETE
jgi:hypothetical protein